MKRNASLEEIVQSSETCNIYRHEQHRDVNENIKKQEGSKAFSYVISCSSTESGCERGPSHSAGIPDDPLKVCLRFTAIGKLATIFGKMNHSIRLKSTPKGTDPKGLHLGFLKYFKKASSNLILPHPCMLLSV